VTIAVFSRIVGYASSGRRTLPAPSCVRSACRISSGCWRSGSGVNARGECQVPLTLSLLAFLSGGEEETPRGRRELFERGIQALLERGDSEGSRGVANPGYARYVLGELSLALQEVAGDAWPLEQLDESLFERSATRPPCA
jgi:hypothetical protein